MDPTIEARPALGIRRRVRMQEIGRRIGELIPRVMAVAAPHMAGPILARWYAWEEYLDDPRAVPAAELRTRIVRPIR